MSPRIKDRRGQRYGRLVARELVGTDKHGSALWLCDCDCGQRKTTTANHLMSGRVKSCGCLWAEINKGIATVPGNKEKKTRLYVIWCSMKQRCDNPKNKAYPLYGGKGVTYCEEWREFAAFREWALANGYKSHLTIDRIDCDGNYKPSNCRWVTRRQQNNNRSNNRRITFRGETLPLSTWAKRIGIHRASLAERLDRGWSIAEALTTPKKSPSDPRRRFDDAQGRRAA